jgi:hypothetical protein
MVNSHVCFANIATGFPRRANERASVLVSNKTNSAHQSDNKQIERAAKHPLWRLMQLSLWLTGVH